MTRTNPNSQAFDYNGLLSKLASDVWKEDNLTGEPIAPKLTDIQEMAIATPEPEKDVTVATNGHAYRLIFLIFTSLQEERSQKKGAIQELRESRKHFFNTEQAILTTTSTIEGGNISPDEHLTVTFIDRNDIEKFLSIISRHILRTAGEPTVEQAKWLQELWKEHLHQVDCDNIEHPLNEVVSAWIKTRFAKRVTTEHDKRYPISVIKSPLGSVRELAFTERDVGQVFQTPERVDQVQMQLDLGCDASFLPSIMPLQIVRTNELKTHTKSGAVSHELRIFFEAMMGLEPGERRKDLMFRLGDLIDFLYPNGKFNWTNQMPHIKRALGVLHTYATVPWIDDQGSLREWRPVVVRSPLPENATRDTPIFVEVCMPPDARHGYLVIKDIHRHIGMKSAPRWNAYHVAAYLWDKHGTVKGKLVDPTRPVERRDTENRLIDATGKPLVNRNGKEIKSAYHPEAIRHLEREANTDAIKRYPVLSWDDLVLACFPNADCEGSGKREYLKRAKKHWQQLEDDGIIVIHKQRDGWRILPSPEHLNAHRAVKKASQGVY